MASVGLFLLMALWIFKRDKTQLVYDINRSTVQNIASEVDTVFRSASDKIEVLAYLSDQFKKDPSLEIGRLFETDKNIVSFALYEKMKTHSPELQFLNGRYAKTYGLDKKYFGEDLPKLRPIPFDAITQSGQMIWSASSADSPLLVGLGRRITHIDDSGSSLDTSFVIAYISLDHIYELVSGEQINEIKIVSQSGEILLSSLESESKHLAGSPVSWQLFQKAKRSPLATSVTDYSNPIEGEILGAFSKSFNSDIFILSRVPSLKAFSVVSEILRRSLVFGMIVLLLTFVAAILFSRSLTRPLELLLVKMEGAARGDLNPVELTSNDETKILAEQFNHMLSEVRISRSELEEINRDLENKVKDRTLKLEEQNQTVKRAQEALLRTTRLASVGEIAGRAAHEILNPLTSIMARLSRVTEKIEHLGQEDVHLNKQIQLAWQKEYDSGGLSVLFDELNKPSSIIEGATLFDEDFENLKSSQSNVEQMVSQMRDDMRFLLNEAHRISKIVQSMRSLSSVKNERDNFSSGALIKESVNIMADLYDQAKIAINLDLSATDYIVSVDRDEFIQSLTNLLRNALQSVIEAKVAKTLEGDEFKGSTLVCSREVEGSLIIEIYDNGVGVRNEDEARLFETQFSTKARAEGTGLGLSIARRFIRNFGGEVDYMKQSGAHQTLFRIKLPLGEMNAEKRVAA